MMLIVYTEACYFTGTRCGLNNDMSVRFRMLTGINSSENMIAVKTGQKHRKIILHQIWIVALHSAFALHMHETV